MSWPTLTNQEVVVSAPIEPTAGDGVAGGWQEVRILTFHDHQSTKTVRHRVRAEIIMAVGGHGYGAASVWASSAWKPIVKLPLAELPPLVPHAREAAEMYADAIDKLMNVAGKIVGG